MTTKLRTFAAALALSAPLALSSLVAPASADQTILNVSYDPTRELYKAYDELFAKHWADTNNGEVVTIEQSQRLRRSGPRAVIDGQPADVGPGLALEADINAIARGGRFAIFGRPGCPGSSAPHTFDGVSSCREAAKASRIGKK